MPEALQFAKGHALGNDYAVIDAANASLPPERWVRGFCDRHRGVGSDGLLVVDRDADADIRLAIFNPDGSRAEKSGNGLRILAAYLHEAGVVGDEPFRVRLPKDTVTLQVEEAQHNGSRLVRAEMGRATFAPEDVGLDVEAGTASVPSAGDAGATGAPSVSGDLDLPLDSGTTARIQPVSLGNPHCVVFVDDLDRDDFLDRAPALATHPAFQAGTNVQFARVAGPASLEARVWERGAGETLASGSSACAVAAAALRHGRVRERALEIHMRGGVLHVDVGDDFACTLHGPARIVYRGEIAAHVIEAWARGGSS